VSDLEILERKVLFVLFVESKRRPNEFFSIKRAASEYHIAAEWQLLEAAFQRWFKIEWAKRFNFAGDVCAKLRPDAFGDAYKQVLRDIDGASISVFPDTREVLTDAICDANMPLPNGWKWLEYEREPGVSPPAKDRNLTVFPEARIDWTKWGTLLGGLSIIVAIFIAVLS
jgi:hypothetical protein